MSEGRAGLSRTSIAFPEVPWVFGGADAHIAWIVTAWVVDPAAHDTNLAGIDIEQASNDSLGAPSTFRVLAHEGLNRRRQLFSRDDGIVFGNEGARLVGTANGDVNLTRTSMTRLDRMLQRVRSGWPQACARR